MFFNKYQHLIRTNLVKSISFQILVKMAGETIMVHTSLVIHSLMMPTTDTSCSLFPQKQILRSLRISCCDIFLSLSSRAKRNIWTLFGLFSIHPDESVLSIKPVLVQCWVKQDSYLNKNKYNKCVKSLSRGTLQTPISILYEYILCQVSLQIHLGYRSVYMDIA